MQFGERVAMLNVYALCFRFVINKLRWCFFGSNLKLLSGIHLSQMSTCNPVLKYVFKSRRYALRDSILHLFVCNPSVLFLVSSIIFYLNFLSN